MEYFLERIARSLREDFGNDLNRHCLVFPGRRAGLYLLKYLSHGLSKPIWAPATYTINDLFRTLSPLQTAGNELLLFELYRVYSSLRRDAGNFDDFYFWGDMLINDFDDTDKYVADASGLFRNVKDLREIDLKFGGLTEEQKEIIKRFWSNFDISKPTDQKSEFLGLWCVMNELYEGFRDALRRQNLAYEGMIFRDVAGMNDKELADSVKWDMVHFIGFNALNNCEKRLMTVLKNAGKARFYWDYDNSYIDKGNHNSAGFFMVENLKTFGNDMPGDWSYDTMLSTTENVKRRVIETSSDVAQVKLIPKLLAEINADPENAHHTAVVLSDETLLVPLLSSLPSDSVDINITMGYPLRQTLVYTLVRNLMDLQRTARLQNEIISFHAPEVMNIIGHPMISAMYGPEDSILAENVKSSGRAWLPANDFAASPLLSGIFIKHDQPATLSAWFRDILSMIALKSGSGEEQTDLNIRNEFIYRIVLALNRLETIIRKPDVPFSADTYLKLLDRLLKSQSVPFSGEPLSGIQIMGILETRALDFKNLIILSVNEGVMPALSSSSSFIPFSLRQAFGLPSVNHQESIFAYHFYRLLQRAENVTFTYNSNSEGLRSGEMSRFLIQMNYDKMLKPEFINVGFEIRTPPLPVETITREDAHIRKLEGKFLNGRALSPSAINTWLGCRMKFFLRYVAEIAEPETVKDEIDPAVFGNILHSAMKQLYEVHSGKVITADILGNLMKNEEYLRKVVDETIIKEFRNGDDGPATGNELIVRDVLFAYLKRILQVDRALAPITIKHLEEFIGFSMDIGPGEKKVKVKTGGYADRIDRVDGSIRIVDYKTGNISESICSIDDLFAGDRPKESDGWLQILLYCEAYLNINNQSGHIRPSIYKIKKMTGRSFNDTLVIKEGRNEIMVEDYSLVREQFIAGLVRVVESIFNPEEPFTMTKEASKCRYCPYIILCSR
ncbi:MAG TPA: PD-(D/E)XK nuclease family protein [Bacteroidales bacterium]|nr:PD-(D/E)XK nuclease family protein [Bacteroidales bacterium]